jgi:homoserine trans-succinylase
VAHDRSGNETNGHSIHEDLLKLYDSYDNVIHKQIDGAVLLGNPILAFTGLEDLTAVIDANKPQTSETFP